MFNKRVLSNLNRYKLTTLISISAISLISSKNDTHCVSDQEMKFIHSTNLDKKVTNVASTFQRYMKKPEENKDLILHYKTNNNISIYYPYYKTFQETNNMNANEKKSTSIDITKDNDQSKSSGSGSCSGNYPYSRIATLTINAPMDDIINLVMSNDVSNWNKKSIVDYEQLSTLPPSLRLAGTGDIEHNIYKPQVGNNTNTKSNSKSKSIPTSTSTEPIINPKNLMLTYKQQNLTSSVFSLNTREFYNWLYQTPAGIIGIYDKFTSVCICNIDASHDYSKLKSVDSSKPIGDGGAILQHGYDDSSISPYTAKQLVRGTSNSIMLLENITPEKVQITYGIELDPNIYYIYNDNNSNSTSNTYSTPLLLNDDMVFLHYLTDLKKSSEYNYNNENTNHSIEETARIRFNKNKQQNESFHLNLKDNTTNSTINSSSTTSTSNNNENEELYNVLIEEQLQLIKILQKSNSKILLDLKSTPNDEDLQEFSLRIQKDLNNATNKYNNLINKNI